MKTALTIAGSDSGGGAGIQADLKTFTAFGVFGTSAITALTAQNTVGVQGIFGIDIPFIEAQIDSVMDDIGADVWKTGMLATPDVIGAVVGRAKKYKIDKLVVDPVMVAKGGQSLLQAESRDAIIAQLLPIAYIVTPNRFEAEMLAGFSIESAEDAKKAAEVIYALGCQNVLVKGANLPEEMDAVDIFYDGTTFTELRQERIDTPHTHGTGCTLSSAIAAGVANGLSVLDAVTSAREYVTQAILTGKNMGIGHGHGPLNHFLDKAIF